MFEFDSTPTPKPHPLLTPRPSPTGTGKDRKWHYPTLPPGYRAEFRRVGTRHYEVRIEAGGEPVLVTVRTRDQAESLVWWWGKDLLTNGEAAWADRLLTRAALVAASASRVAQHLAECADRLLAAYRDEGEKNPGSGYLWCGADNLKRYMGYLGHPYVD